MLIRVANEFFTPYAVTQFWIGANDLKIPNQWTWEDGLKWGFTKWQKGHPFINDTVRNCGAMWIANGQWISSDCNEEKFFICSFGHIPTTPVHVKPTTPCNCDKSSTSKPLVPTTLKPVLTKPPTPKVTAFPTAKTTKAKSPPSPPKTTVLSLPKTTKLRNEQLKNTGAPLFPPKRR
uniref:C-type lectin domain-containing protein n=1 Tax=Panagrolaimus davidi TaxID=227884 RepID=A0A914Q7K7_9BILA